MKLLSQSGTNTIRLDAPSQSGTLLNVAQIVSSDLSGLETTGWKVGVIFVISDIRVSIKVDKTLTKGDIPRINAEDSTATILSESIRSEKNSELIGLEFLINEKPLGLFKIKNYEDTFYNVPALRKISSRNKLLGKKDLMLIRIIDLGSGTLSLGDYIDISVDYVYDLDGFKPQEDLSLRFV
ncbi:MAG: hypothetical protein F6K40_02515 [Okeania sp. SIO3I5]|uniref:hypothetical protein n=1 Tax=Okeania sp. SIO3I5 TaxID=2607805 RepID=UPI0013B751B2|nr:hypothetical protein [Okeania sp. SIO3I5]NEQ35239.1 hypothetical protein [Okeania sp. SIO3I5]